MILTVTIPTYNRPEQIKNMVLRLIPQLDNRAQILVIDNNSDSDIKTHLYNTIPELESVNIKVLRNRTNVGGEGNMLKCFELCETPYLWLLGDDDKVEENAVEIILGEIEKYKNIDLVGFNFNSNCVIGTTRDVPIIINSIKELTEKLDVFGNWLFMSTGVYRTAEYVKHLQYAIWGSYSMASFTIPVMRAIRTGKTFILSEKYIVTNVPVADVKEKWSDYQLALSLSSILEANVGFKKDEYKALGSKLDVHFSCIWPADIMYTIIRSVNYNIDLIDNYHLFIYKQLIQKTWEFRTKKAEQRKQYYICLFLLKNKAILKTLCSVMPKIKNKAKQFTPFYLFKRDSA